MQRSGNHYRTLGIDPAADDATIRAAYLDLMRRLHPDRAGSEADRARVQDVIAAYKVLRDPEQRAAYDRGRLLVMGGQVPALPIGSQQAARGGAAARNLFLLLASATAWLAYWAWQQPPSAGPGGVTQPAPASVAPNPELPDIRPAEDIAAADLPLPIEPEAADTQWEPPVVVLPEQAEVELPAPLPEVSRPVRPRTNERRVLSQPAPKGSAPAAATIDLTGLERHLRLLTDQSFRVGTETERARLSTTADAFVRRLDACANDLCRRDVYLRRNQEVAEIMRD